MKIQYLLIVSLFSSTLFSQSYFQKKADNTPIENKTTATTLVASIPYQGYDETQAYFGEGEYEIFLDIINGELDKPIIILDGFDPGDGRDINGLYNSLSYGGDNMADVLRSEGFDIVILNAPLYTTDGKDIDGGSDYIQRNAMVLVELINLLNDQKIGDEELVVLGPSMGGLIGRYALSYMEQNSLDPETRLYISFDSPHKGANIPISLQYLINYLAQQLGDPQAIAIVDDVLNSPAAKEMLYDHLSGHLLSGSTFEQDPTLVLPAGAPNFRAAFQAELDALGFPQNVRNVAMINGSGQGTTTGTAGMQVVSTNVDLGSGLSADIELHFTPAASQTNSPTFVETLFTGIPLTEFTTEAESFSFTDGIDSAPGGTSNISSALGGGGSSNPIIVAFIAALDQDDYSFIPTISALAIENEDNWFATPDIGGTHTSPFVNTFIPSENESHVAVTPESAQFALDEIRNGVAGISDFNASEKYVLDRNPVTDAITLHLKTSTVSEKVQLSIYNSTGQLLINETYSNPASEITLKHALQSGIYLLQVEDSENTQTLKFVVK